jgi:hypothetical protein
VLFVPALYAAWFRVKQVQTIKQVETAAEPAR